MSSLETRIQKLEASQGSKCNGIELGRLWSRLYAMLHRSKGEEAKAREHEGEAGEAKAREYAALPRHSHKDIVELLERERI